MNAGLHYHLLSDLHHGLNPRVVKLLHHQLGVVNVWLLLVVGLEASDKVWVRMTKGLHQALERLFELLLC